MIEIRAVENGFLVRLGEPHTLGEEYVAETWGALLEKIVDLGRDRLLAGKRGPTDRFAILRGDECEVYHRALTADLEARLAPGDTEAPAPAWAVGFSAPLSAEMAHAFKWIAGLSSRRRVALMAIAEGLEAAERKHAPDSIANPRMPDSTKMGITAEEFAEVCAAFTERNHHSAAAYEALRRELVDLGACALGWIEALG